MRIQKTALILAVCFLFSQIHLYTTAAAETGNIMSLNYFNQRFWPPNQRFWSPKWKEFHDEDEKEKEAEKTTEIQSEPGNFPDLINEIKGFNDYINSDEFRALQKQIRESDIGKYLHNATKTIPQVQNNPETKKETLPSIQEKPEKIPVVREDQGSDLNSNLEDHTSIKLFFAVISFVSFLLAVAKLLKNK